MISKVKKFKFLFYCFLLSSNVLAQKPMLNIADSAKKHEWCVKFDLKEKLKQEHIYRLKFRLKSKGTNSKKIYYLHSLIMYESKALKGKHALQIKGFNYKTKTSISNNQETYIFEYFHAPNGREKAIVFWLTDELLQLQKWQTEFSILDLRFEDVTDIYQLNNLIPNGDFEIYHFCPYYCSGINNGFLQEMAWQKLDEFAYDSIIYAQDQGDINNAKQIKLMEYASSYTGRKRKSNSLSDYPEQISLDNSDYMINPTPYSGRNCALISDLDSDRGVGRVLKVKLKSPLIAGQRYNFSLAYCVYGGAKYFGTNQIGVLFSQYPVSFRNYTGGVPSKVFASFPLSEEILSDTTWKLVSHEFIATGGEEYLSIGRIPIKNFEVRNSTFAGLRKTEFLFGYYYIDNVELYRIDN